MYNAQTLHIHRTDIACTLHVHLIESHIHWVYMHIHRTYYVVHRTCIAWHMHHGTAGWKAHLLYAGAQHVHGGLRRASARQVTEAHCSWCGRNFYFYPLARVRSQ